VEGVGACAERFESMNSRRQIKGMEDRDRDTLDRRTWLYRLDRREMAVEVSTAREDSPTVNPLRHKEGHLGETDTLSSQRISRDVPLNPLSPCYMY